MTVGSWLPLCGSMNMEWTGKGLTANVSEDSSRTAEWKIGMAIMTGTVKSTGPVLCWWDVLLFLVGIWRKHFSGKVLLRSKLLSVFGKFRCCYVVNRSVVQDMYDICKAASGSSWMICDSLGGRAFCMHAFARKNWGYPEVWCLYYIKYNLHSDSYSFKFVRGLSFLVDEIRYTLSDWFCASFCLFRNTEHAFRMTSAGIF